MYRFIKCKFRKKSNNDGCKFLQNTRKKWHSTRSTVHRKSSSYRESLAKFMSLYGCTCNTSLMQLSQNRPAAGSMSRPLYAWGFDRLHSRRKIFFFSCYRQRTKKAEKTPKKKLPNNNLKVSVPYRIRSRIFKTQTSFQSFFCYKSGNIHRFYRSIGKKNVTFTSSI